MTTIDFTTNCSIAATPATVWQAIIDPAKVAQYHLAPLRLIELVKGGRIIYGTDEAEMITGQVIEFAPGSQLTHTFRFAPDIKGTEKDPETTVSYLLKEEGNHAKLTLIHSGFPTKNQTYANISDGWNYILNSLKGMLENKEAS